MEIDELIEQLIDELKAPEKQQKGLVGKGKLLYPVKGTETGRAQESRFSEQEAKQVFIRLIEENDEDYYYSVETPTKEQYRFSRISSPAGKRKPCRPSVKEGQSGNIDVSLYKKSFLLYDLVSHVEFKANQTDTEGYEIAKDLLKLLVEPDVKGSNYFVHILKSSSLRTWESLSQKYEKIIGYFLEDPTLKEEVRNQVVIYMISLSPKRYVKCELNQLVRKDQEKLKINKLDDVKLSFERFFSNVSVIESKD